MEEKQEGKVALEANMIAPVQEPVISKPKSKARSNNSKRKQEFISLAMTAGMTAEEAEEYWKRER